MGLRNTVRSAHVRPATTGSSHTPSVTDSVFLLLPLLLLLLQARQGKRCCHKPTHQPCPKGGTPQSLLAVLSFAALNLNDTRCGPSTAMLLSTMKAPEGGKVMTFCSRCALTSITCAKQQQQQQQQQQLSGGGN
jgi:hypothetical protein